ncbi:MAG: hypothetical protein IPP88_05145 [Betaproteobacteria bacterium]|nr:hypothetical protein [Betaproteobacteria bacterium]
MSQSPADVNSDIAIFNPRPSIQEVRLTADHSCLIVDDALVNPEALVQFACAHRDEFGTSQYAYPGIELPMPADFTDRLEAFFSRYIRRPLNGRRTLQRYCRLSMVTLTPDQLQPVQSICHRDNQRVEPGQCIAASVLYLFHDSSLGGTSFYMPRKSAEETERLVHDAKTLDRASFARKYSIEPGYFCASNDYFELAGTVPAQWNRMIFYDGSIFHSGDIRAPEKLNDDPRAGRLTLNGFFTCSRKAT